MFRPIEKTPRIQYTDNLDWNEETTHCLKSQDLNISAYSV
jgi:hypothetical protein